MAFSFCKPLMPNAMNASSLTVPVYNAVGETIRTVALDPAIFGLTPKPSLVQRAVLAQTANSRQTLAHTKTRSEVRGGGKKPWRQKGTGRARHGSIRSPLWVGGGVAFGPRSTRNFAVRINKKEARQALFMTLSAKVRAQQFVVLDALTIPERKTKHVATLLQRLPAVDAKRALVVQPAPDADFRLAARNLPRCATILANALNVVDVLRHDVLVLPEQSLDIIRRTFRPVKKTA